MNNETKIQKVLKLLLKGNKISARYSSRVIGYDRLASGICRLRKKGYPILTLKEKGQEGSYYARYYICSHWIKNYVNSKKSS